MVLFVTGIDTNVGKSIATAYLYKKMLSEGVKVITQKLVQTGCMETSEDIETHRRLAHVGVLEEDKEGLTCPYIFTYPCSPHLAAEHDNRTIDVKRIKAATDVLSAQYDVILLEGAGGLMVPWTRDLLTIDYVKRCSYPVVLVTSGCLGSLNHTLLSLEAIQRRDMPLHSVIYNQFPVADELINADSLDFIKNYCGKYFPSAKVEVMPVWEV